MDADAAIDRRRLRRKLGFWRALTIAIIAIALAIAVYRAFPAGRYSDHIAHVSISGVIQDDDGVVEMLDDIAKDGNAKALVVSLSTPGGTTYGGERLHKALLRVGDRKPVVADVRTLAASAGYMLAASTDHIVAGETSIIGSIGVIFQYPQVGELLDKVGVKVNEIKSAPLKAEPSPFHTASPEAEGMIRNLVMDSFDWFVDLVAERRDMDRAKALSLADGSIFTGRQGLANGLVDAVGGEVEIRAYLAERGVEPTLDFVDWLPAENAPAPLITRISALLIERLSGNAMTIPEQIERLGGGKLFLDGLLSVWQAGPNSSTKEY